MFAVIRRYEGIETGRLDELTAIARDELVPRLAEEPGFMAYYLLDAGNGVIASFGAFESREGAERSNEIAATFIREHGLGEAMPNAPEITAGDVIAQRILQTTTA